MAAAEPIYGVLLSDAMDLKSYYGLDFGDATPDVRLLNPDEVTNPDLIRFAVCWLPGPAAFAPYLNIEMAMSVGAGVDALLKHPGLNKDVAICRVRDPNQADLMAGYAVHEVVHVERGFARMQQSQASAEWAPPAIRPPHDLKVAVLGHGSMGASVVKALAACGFSVSVACRRAPTDPVEGVDYFTGDDSVLKSVVGQDVVINVLPLTAETENILDADLFAKLAKGAWLIQIGRGEHLVEEDLVAALDSGQLSGATLDVFRTEPLPSDHPFWSDPRLRITPHIASDTTPHIVAEQALQSARELHAGRPLSLAISRGQGY
ncbi:hydroxyacid dehydrogenase [Thalassospira sp. HJ]|uniref:NAD(P)-dependent oxidoreductase n=1 Tax=Thalassospira sp. HJ TaxID=1616823 RepID=UPI0005CEF924|nr:NAD(P)-dependent oxidoreductase [Thalassospira sp. HJ]KJE33721.1 hydroxyacid dehydrogenase [Thalassospira sp. HJ]